MGGEFLVAGDLDSHAQTNRRLHLRLTRRPAPVRAAPGRALDREELRSTFRRAREIGLLDIDAVHRSRARVEWRPSLAMLDEVIAEFS